ncbi:hypothetical protein DQ04_04321010 [Trypanosoma grayi]|uniref:hypothetical protein n=1 Tax=Trypanosoma grayi TaxID=71804 RepID=UPI0004F40D85|nr:hypothetical protein DQ04_04321010 [Trypanosoma grayi]KEG09997.1 hypothetical protein DQ04_04321010 [Trypanosoma grayi]
MYDDAEPGVGRVDPVEYFSSRRGLRTAGYAQQHRSQIVFGNEGAATQGSSSTSRRARGPGRDFADFVEAFGFPAPRPKPQSQRRIFAASAQPGSINVLQRPAEEAALRMPLSRGHWGPKWEGSFDYRQQQPQEQQQQRKVEGGQQEEWQDEIAPTRVFRNGEETPVLHDDEELIALSDERIQTLEQALEHEKRRLLALEKGRRYRRARSAHTVSPPLDASNITTCRGRSGSSNGEGRSNNNINDCVTSNGWKQNTSPPPPQQQQQKGNRRAPSSQRNDSSYDITPKITVIPSPLSSRGNGTASQPEWVKEAYARHVTSGRVRGRSNWTLTEHYAGWQ